MFKKFVKWGVLAAACLLVFETANWHISGEWKSITLGLLLDAPDSNVSTAGTDFASLIMVPIWIWTVLASFALGSLAAFVDRMDTWWKFRQAKRWFRQVQAGLSK
jgi:hypothetical protein